MENVQRVRMVVLKGRFKNGQGTPVVAGGRFKEISGNCFEELVFWVTPATDCF
jgi:hypothetical protein